MADNASKHALIVRGGWDGHQPIEATDLFIPFLTANGYSVRVAESPQPYADAGYMRTVDLIVQCNTMATIERMALEGLRAAIEGGTGMAGWHGGIADSYRNSSDYLHLIGGQFACHPGKHPDQRTGDQSDNYVPYRINMVPAAAEHPITRGMPRQWLHVNDELYDKLRGPGQNMHILATTYADPAKGGSGHHEHTCA